MENTQLLLRLIKEDLKLNAFINDLTQAGLILERYSPHINEVIFELAGVPEGDEDIYDLYWQFLDGLSHDEVIGKLDILSTQFYAELTAFRHLHAHCRRRVRQAS